MGKMQKQAMTGMVKLTRVPEEVGDPVEEGREAGDDLEVLGMSHALLDEEEDKRRGDDGEGQSQQNDLQQLSSRLRGWVAQVGGLCGGGIHGMVEGEDAKVLGRGARGADWLAAGRC